MTAVGWSGRTAFLHPSASDRNHYKDWIAAWLPESKQADTKSHGMAMERHAVAFFMMSDRRSDHFPPSLAPA
jgi:hypothetical protein